MPKTNDQTPHGFFLNVAEDDPNHYQLLGLESFEADPNTIRDAATDQNRKLMRWQNSNEHHRAVRQLMMRIAEARLILLDPEKKSAYDQQLKTAAAPPASEKITQDELVAAENARETVSVLDEMETTAADLPITEHEDEQLTNHFDHWVLYIAWGLVAVVLLVVALTFYLPLNEAIAWVLILGIVGGGIPLGVSKLWKILKQNNLGSELLKIGKSELKPSPLTEPELLITPCAFVEAKRAQQDWADFIGEDVIVSVRGQSLALIPPGEFLMGADDENFSFSDESPAHRVRITQPFYLAQTPVTQHQWNTLMGKPSVPNPQDRFPVTHVSWEAAMEYCRRLSALETESGRLTEGWTYTLPTEAQWEYACRAGSGAAYCFGDDVRLLGRFANYSQDFQIAVGAKVPNVWNLFDMHGNVLEWCLDFYNDSYYHASPIEDPPGPDSGRYHVARGGSWRSTDEECTASARFMRSRPEEDLGFRVALVFGL